MTDRGTPIIEGRGLTRSFAMPAGAVTALGDVSIRVDSRDYVAITGPSGCGKSTLLHILGCVDQASAGSLVFERRNRQALELAAGDRRQVAEREFVDDARIGLGGFVGMARRPASCSTTSA